MSYRERNTHAHIHTNDETIGGFLSKETILKIYHQLCFTNVW